MNREHDRKINSIEEILNHVFLKETWHDFENGLDNTIYMGTTSENQSIF